MGGVKNAMIEADELGWSPSSELNVCAACIEDDALAKVVAENLESNTCNFCNQSKKRKFAASINNVSEHMARRINHAYVSAESELPFDSETSTFFGGATYDIREIFDDIEFAPSNIELQEALLDTFDESRVWTDRNPMILGPVERRRSGWKTFKDAVKHKRRYTFWSVKSDDVNDDHPDHLPVGNMLAEIGQAIISANIISELPEGSVFWRVRVHDKAAKVSTIRDITPPPENKATKANRMSPPGIPMFYGARNFETACIETLAGASEWDLLTSAQFTTVTRLRILDLAKLPDVPSFFDESGDAIRHDLSFLHSFAHDIAEPIENDDHQHIHYVPTQAFTEYVRYELKNRNGKRINGIRFKSSKTGRPCIVLFCGQDQCLDKVKLPRLRQWLRCDHSTMTTVSVREILKRGLKRATGDK